MKKLVAESIEEALQYKTSLNEGKIGDIIRSTFKSLKKVGNLFLDFYEGKILPLLPPINLGILFKNKQLPKAVSIIPSESDVLMVPSLENLRNKEAFIKRVEDREDEYARLRKAKGGLKNARPFDFNRIVSFDDDPMNEAEVKLEYTGTDAEDKVKNAGTRFLVNRLLIQIADPSLTPPLIWGAPGIGKTSITRTVVESLGRGHRLIDVQTSIMAPDDWTLPAIVKSIEQGIKMGKMYDVETIEAKDIPKDWLPVYTISDDPEENARRNDKANDGEGGIVFLDELSRAAPEVQNTCLKLVHERQIGGKKLGSKWAIVSATNRDTDDQTGQTSIGSALSNRFEHFNFVPTADEWIEWGAKFGNIDPRILTFVDFNRSHFYLFDNVAKVNTTPRSWEALSKMLAACQKYSHIVFTKADIDLLVGANVHSKTYEAFVAFLVLIETFHPSQIQMLFTNPKKAPKPVSKGGQPDIPMARALIGASISNSKERTLEAKEVENFVQYWIDLGNQSLASAALFLLVEHHDYINFHIGEDGSKSDKYKKAMDMFRAKFGGIKFANMNRADIMGNIS